MRSSALIAASLASNALAFPFAKRYLVTDLEIVTVTKYVTAGQEYAPPATTITVNPVPATTSANNWFTWFAPSSSATSSVVVVTSVASAAPVAPTTEAAPSTEAAPAPATTSVTAESAAPTYAPVTTEAPTTTEAPSSTYVAPTTSAAADGGLTYARCATPSVPSTATLTAQPTALAQQKWLAYHNAHRANFTDGCSMYYDYDLEAKAMESAKQCNYEHTNSGLNYGQNMGQMSYSAGGSVSDSDMTNSPEFFMNLYYTEVDDFGPYFGQAQVPVDGSVDILHFTQMVWKESYAVGCATNDCGTMMLTYCNYYPRGNMAGEYANQVGSFISSPLKPICAEIGSTATDGSCLTDSELGVTATA